MIFSYAAMGLAFVCQMPRKALYRMEEIAMLLYEETKAFEKALGPEATQLLAKVFERQSFDFRDGLATREDLLGARSELKDEIISVRSELKEEIANVRSELKEEIASVRSEFKEEIASVRSELKGEIAALRSELKEEIATVYSELKGVRSELKEEIAALRSEMKDVKHEMLKWFIGVALAQSALTVGVLSLMK